MWSSVDYSGTVPGVSSGGVYDAPPTSASAALTWQYRSTPAQELAPNQGLDANVAAGAAAPRPGAGSGAQGLSSYVPVVVGPDGQAYVHVSQLQALGGGGAPSAGAPGYPDVRGQAPPVDAQYGMSQGYSDARERPFYTVEALDGYGGGGGVGPAGPNPRAGGPYFAAGARDRFVVAEPLRFYSSNAPAAHGGPMDPLAFAADQAARRATVYGGSAYDRSRGPGAVHQPRPRVVDGRPGFQTPWAAPGVPLKPRPVLKSCSLCKLQLSSFEMAIHLKGKRHLAAVEAREKEMEERKKEKEGGKGKDSKAAAKGASSAADADAEGKGEKDTKGKAVGQPAAAASTAGKAPKAQDSPSGKSAQSGAPYVPRACTVCPGVMMASEEVFLSHRRGKTHLVNLERAARGLPPFTRPRKATDPTRTPGAGPTPRGVNGTAVGRAPPPAAQQNRKRAGDAGGEGEGQQDASAVAEPRQKRPRFPPGEFLPGTAAFRAALVAKGEKPFSLDPWTPGVCEICGAKLLSEANAKTHSLGKRHKTAEDNKVREENGEDVNAKAKAWKKEGVAADSGKEGEEGAGKATAEGAGEEGGGGEGGVGGETEKPAGGGAEEVKVEGEEDPHAADGGGAAAAGSEDAGAEAMDADVAKTEEAAGDKAAGGAAAAAAEEAAAEPGVDAKAANAGASAPEEADEAIVDV